MPTTELADLERRIRAALDRIAQAAEAAAEARVEARVEAGSEAKPEAEPPPVAPDASAEAALREALEAERAANAQLSERLRSVRARQEAALATLERKLARANETLDVQGFELQRLKRVNGQLAEANRKLVEAQAAERPDAGAAMRALQAELDAERAARRAEMAELEEIMAELRPLIGAAEGATGTAETEGERIHG